MTILYIYFTRFCHYGAERVIAILRYKLLEMETRDIGVYLENSLLSRK